MKTLLDIQDEIRQLEESAKGITKNLATLNYDVDELRNSGDTMVIDWDGIDKISKNIDLGKHPIGELMNAELCKYYLELLINMIRLDPDEDLVIKRLAFVQWLTRQANTDWTLEDLYEDTFRENENLLPALSKELHEKYREYLMLDALIVANIGGQANKELLEYLSDIAVTLDIQLDQMKRLITVSKVVLCNSIKELTYTEANSLMLMGDYSYYIGPELENIKARFRKKVFNVKVNAYGKFEWAVSQKAYVKEDEIIARFYKNNYQDRPSKVFRTPFDGILYQVKVDYNDRSTYYGIISSEHDDLESVRKWVEQLNEK